MDINQEHDILQARDIKQIKLSLIKSFTKNVQVAGDATGNQHDDEDHQIRYAHQQVRRF